MAGAVSGTVRLACTLKTVIASGLSTLLNSQASYDQSWTYAAGTGANSLNRIYAQPGSAAASPASLDLSALVTADGGVGFSHWRTIVVHNDDPINTLTWDFTATNANTAMFGAGGTTAKVVIQPGACQPFFKPAGTNGYVVDGTHKVISLDPGANTVNYRVYVFGD